jgi:GNAT superfamily N-acetyltransferase
LNNLHLMNKTALKSTHSITILPFQPEDQAEARDLILAGLAGHWGTLDPSKNPDLQDIASSYAHAVFLVARCKERMVGTGAFLPRLEHEAEIVRMSVAADMRRKGIGHSILDSLCQQARSSGIQRLILETTQTWEEVIEFYKQFGFQVTHSLDGDIYFALDLDLHPEIGRGR